MQMNTTDRDADTRDHELEEELAGILTAISIVAKRLARKLDTLQRKDGTAEEGGAPDGQDE